MAIGDDALITTAEKLRDIRSAERITNQRWFKIPKRGKEWSRDLEKLSDEKFDKDEEGVDDQKVEILDVIEVHM